MRHLKNINDLTNQRYERSNIIGKESPTCYHASIENMREAAVYM